MRTDLCQGSTEYLDYMFLPCRVACLSLPLPGQHWGKPVPGCPLGHTCSCTTPSWLHVSLRPPTGCCIAPLNQPCTSAGCPHDSGLLAADTAKTGEILGQAVLDVPPLMCSAVFCGGLAGLCYFLEPDQLDKANGGLLAAVLLSFVVCSHHMIVRMSQVEFC